MITLERAISLAAEAHAGQVDKAGQPYILHPLRVMLAMDTDEERIVAVFHDVLEDCSGWDEDRLWDEGFTLPMVEALLILTKLDTERGEDGYMRFIRRTAAHPIARKVKMADLCDNLDARRIVSPTAQDMKRRIKYQSALELLATL